MAETLETSQWVPYPVELVFAFFANPGNLPHLMPAWQGTRIERSILVPPAPRPLATDPALRFKSPAAGVGSEMVISFHALPVLPLRLKWTARIIEFVWNSHFIDEQISGPFHSWCHQHGFASEVRKGLAGTLITDHIEYALPLGPLGAIGNSVFVGRQMQDTFLWRQHRLDEILPAAARQAGLAPAP